MNEIKFDRTAFWAGKNAENEARINAFWQSKTATERLNAACYLNSVAYNYDINNPPKVDKTAFSMRKRD